MKERELQSLTDRFHTFNVFEGYHIRKDGALSAVWQLTELNLLRLTELESLPLRNIALNSMIKHSHRNG